MGVKKHYIDREFAELARQKSVLAALSNDLMLPFLQIKTNLESAGDISLENKDAMLVSMEAGLQLIEAYRLALMGGHNLDLEPVAVGAVLQDVAHQLYPYAKHYSTEVEVDISGKLAPVLAHKPSLAAALQVLGTSIIRGQSAAADKDRQSLLLGAHRSANNFITTGVFSSLEGFSSQTLRNAHRMAGRARQPVAGLPLGSAAGVLIADMLCASMWQPLRAAAHHKMSGLATSIPATKQLNFI